MLHYLSESDIRTLVEGLTADVFPGVPAFQLAGEAGRGRLLSALDQPRWPHHRTAIEKAAALHYSLNKNHPYIDGNKRLAVTAMEYFLLRNGYVLCASEQELVDFALQVADNRMSREASADWLRYRGLRITWSEERARRWLQSLPAEHAAGVAASMRLGSTEGFLAAVAPRLADRALRLAEEAAPYDAVVA